MFSHRLNLGKRHASTRGTIRQEEGEQWGKGDKEGMYVYDMHM
jgi:hypothetical protein